MKKIEELMSDVQTYASAWSLIGGRFDDGTMLDEATRVHKNISYELESLLADNDRLADVLMRNGFVRCDSPACNCGSWHARHGLRERMDEIAEALETAGYPLSNENGNLTINALSDLISEVMRLRQLA